MRKIALHFTLVGKSNSWERGLSIDTIHQHANKDRLAIVKKMVADQFGERALVVANEKALSNILANYPGYFAAGWFISEDAEDELVMVGHGDSMEAANLSMMEAIKNVDWDQMAVKI